jgi:thioredoxin reductase (NADPH)
MNSESQKSPWEMLSREQREKLFPTLTASQIERVAAYGKKRQASAGEVLIEQGDYNLPFVVVISGSLEVVRNTDIGEELVVLYTAGNFLGDVTMLSSRRSLMRARMRDAGEIVEIDRRSLQGVVQSDAELGDIFMRAFILRRIELIAHGWGDAVVLGSSNSAGTLRIREFLSRNGHPYSYIDLDHDSGVQEVLDRFHVDARDVPILICRGKLVLRNPTTEQVADCLGFNEGIEPGHLRDVIIVGAGPAGLSSAVYAASEGLSTLVVETTAPGGQAGSSSNIENYLGFPTGISGQELAGRAYIQAQKFGAEMMVARSAIRLNCDRKPYMVEMDDGMRFATRTVVIATGAQYRKLPLENLSRFEGTGVYYGATSIEAQMCGREEVVVVGGGNSAGQAAVFLSGTAGHVHILIRSDALASTMSRYLVRRIEENPAITLHTNTEMAALEGDGQLERVQWRNNQTGKVEDRTIRHVFVMTGANPNTQWLNGCAVQDKQGFLKTGSALTPEDLASAHWPHSRAPYLFETSLPGVFAVGDVRSGNTKRIASAVGEGSVAISLVHQVLHE